MMNKFRGTIALFLNSPAKKLADVIGVEEERVAHTYLDLKNKMNEEEFSSIDPKNRIVLVPQCLRASGCVATQDEFGYHCKLCGKCKIAAITKEARKKGSKVFILPGASVVPRIIKKFEPQAILGVACFRELMQHPRFKSISMILETPKDFPNSDKLNLNVLRKLRREKSPF